MKKSEFAHLLNVIDFAAQKDRSIQVEVDQYYEPPKLDAGMVARKLKEIDINDITPMQVYNMLYVINLDVNESVLVIAEAVWDIDIPTPELAFARQQLEEG